jgi:hypothetical protein
VVGDREGRLRRAGMVEVGGIDVADMTFASGSCKGWLCGDRGPWRSSIEGVAFMVYPNRMRWRRGRADADRFSGRSVEVSGEACGFTQISGVGGVGK